MSFFNADSPHLLFLGDFIGEDFGGVEDFDGGFIFEDVALGGGESVEDFVLDLLEGFLIGSALYNEGLSLFLQFWPN